MKKRLLQAAVIIAGAVFAVAVAGFIRFNFTDGGDLTGPESLAVTIDGQQFRLERGVAELPAAPGSAAMNTLRAVGDPTSGADGDLALVVVNDPGGSGRFYYAVIAMADGGSYRATNAVPLGDRISPQRVEYRDGRFVYHFLGHGPDQPMSAPPTVEHTVAVRLDRAGRVISTE